MRVAIQFAVQTVGVSVSRDDGRLKVLRTPLRMSSFYADVLPLDAVPHRQDFGTRTADTSALETHTLRLVLLSTIRHYRCPVPGVTRSAFTEVLLQAEHLTLNTSN